MTLVVEECRYWFAELLLVPEERKSLLHDEAYCVGVDALLNEEMNEGGFNSVHSQAWYKTKRSNVCVVGWIEVASMV